MKRYIAYILVLSLFPFLWGACDDSDSDPAEKGKITAAFGTLHLKSFENVTPLLLPVVLSQPAPDNMNVAVEVKSEAGAVEGVHYSFLSKSVVIAKGSSVGYIEINLFDDREVNPDRDFYVELLEVKGAVISEGKDVCRITIQSDEGFPTVEFQKTLASIGEDEGELLLNVELGRVFDKEVTFKIHALNGSAEEGIHFSLPRTEFSLPAGETEIAVPVTIIDDIDINDDRVFWLELTDPVNAVVSEVYGTCKVTIANDDTPVYVSFAEQSRKVFESDEFVYIPVKVEGTAKKPVTLTVKVTDEEQTDLDMSIAQITLPIGVRTDSVKILLHDNDVIDKDRKYTFYIDEVVNAEKAAADTVMSLTVMNDDLDYNKLYDELLGSTWLLELKDPGNLRTGVTVTFSGGSSLEEEDQNYRNTFIATALKWGEGWIDIKFKISYDATTGDVAVVLGELNNITQGILVGGDPVNIGFDRGSAAKIDPVPGKSVGKGYRKLVFSEDFQAGLYYADTYSDPEMRGKRHPKYFYSHLKSMTLTRVD